MFSSICWINYSSYPRYPRVSFGCSIEKIVTFLWFFHHFLKSTSEIRRCHSGLWLGKWIFFLMLSRLKDSPSQLSSLGSRELFSLWGLFSIVYNSKALDLTITMMVDWSLLLKMVSFLANQIPQQIYFGISFQILVQVELLFKGCGYWSFKVAKILTIEDC